MTGQLTYQKEEAGGRWQRIANRAIRAKSHSKMR